MDKSYKATEHRKCNFGGKHLIFTCLALAKAGLVDLVGPLCPSICPSVPNTLGVPSLCNVQLKKFLYNLFKICLVIVHILKMCTSYFAHVS